jgi:signal transduction histidine kinase
MIDALQVCSHLLFVAAFLGSAGTGGKAPARLRLLAFAAAAVLIAATGYSWLTGGVEGVVRYHDLSYELDPLFEFGVHDLPELASAAVMVAWLIAMLVASALLLREGANGAALFALGALLLVGGLLFNSFGDEVIEGLDDENFALPYIFLLDGLLFAAAMVRQAFGLRTERDDALAQELAATREQARLSQTLLTTREDRDRARARAEVHRSRLALAGHDLRQPLTSLRLAIDAADDTNAELGDKLRDSLDYLRSLLDDILSDTMPEPATDGHAAPLTGMEDTPLAVVFANARRMFDDEARAKGLSLEVAETDVVVSTDPVTLIRMVSNLVSNAVKYTDAGGITVSASENDGRVRIDVADTGPGMEPDEIGSILQSYTRGTASDGTDGTGIGLSSVQSHARALGLALEVQSTPGQGSVFSLVGLRAV